MGTARSSCKIPAVAGLCDSFGLHGVEHVGALLMGLAQGRNCFGIRRRSVRRLVRITVHDGKASIREEQPHFIETGDKDLAVVIDTRENKQKDALDYLKDVSTGAVLARDSVVTKSQGQIRIIPLKGIPDLVVNSRNLRALLR